MAWLARPGRDFDTRIAALGGKRLAPVVECDVDYEAPLSSGSAAEPAMSELYRALHQGRRANLSLVARSICDNETSPSGLSVEATTDILWQLASPEMFNLLTGVGGYSTERYTEWLAGMLKAALSRDS